MITAIRNISNYNKFNTVNNLAKPNHRNQNTSGLQKTDSVSFTNKNNQLLKLSDGTMNSIKSFFESISLNKVYRYDEAGKHNLQVIKMLSNGKNGSEFLDVKYNTHRSSKTNPVSMHFEISEKGTISTANHEVSDPKQLAIYDSIIPELLDIAKVKNLRLNIS